MSNDRVCVRLYSRMHKVDTCDEYKTIIKMTFTSTRDNLQLSWEAVTLFNKYNND